jgi:hypothetical protein
MKLNSKTGWRAARMAQSAVSTLYRTSRSAAASMPKDRATGKITTLALRRVDTGSAFRFGLIFGPILYTLVGLALSLNGVGIGHLDYLVGLLKAVLLGGAGGVIFAVVYNAIARRYGPLKFDLEVMIHESQDNARSR